MNSRMQRGYLDMQIMPSMIGVVLLFVVLGMTGIPALDAEYGLFKFYGFMLLAVTAIVFGFVMHLYSLGYPESPFNKHSSPVFMSLLCAGPLIYGAYRLYKADMYAGMIILAVLAVLICTASIAFSLLRKPSNETGVE